MTKLRITVIFALTVIIVVTLYAEQKHRQAVTAADAAISLHGELLVEQGRQIFRMTPLAIRITGVCSDSTRQLKEQA